MKPVSKAIKSGLARVQVRIGQPISAVLQKGYIFRPGLVSLLALALQATKQVELEKTKTELLLDALKLAEVTLKTPVNPDHCRRVINELRKTV
jgi:hypothetical protein